MRFLAALLGGGAMAAALGASLAAGSGVVYPPVTPGHPLEFPRDFGSHPGFRTEWWYVTGWVTTDGGENLGFQVTFFRTRPQIDESNPSSFAPRQLLIAHCGISDPRHGRLWQDQRIRRAGLGLTGAAEGDTDIHIEDWSLQRMDGVYRTHVAGEDFGLDLSFEPKAPPLINGDAGFSRKGPATSSASYYYSLPHMKTLGVVTRAGRRSHVSGEAWFDHEWSSEYLDAGSVGWDWTGINLDDGSALMAFRIRGADGNTRWAGGSVRSPEGTVRDLQPGDVDFTPGRTWVSPRTGIRYPVEWLIHAGSERLQLVPLLDDQENDTRLTTGAIYWEGAVRATAGGKTVGRGYLELTGYGARLKLR
jgi:predicted secreted hydrolase